LKSSRQLITRCAPAISQNIPPQKAAKSALGISRSTVHRKITELGINMPELTSRRRED